MDTRGGARASKCDDVLDLGEREPKPAGLTDEGQESEDGRRVATVPGSRPARRRQDAARLI